MRCNDVVGSYEYTDEGLEQVVSELTSISWLIWTGRKMVVLDKTAKEVGKVKGWPITIIANVAVAQRLMPCAEAQQSRDH